MYCLKNAARLMHMSSIKFVTDKSLLSALRKKTGYTFSNCKKALEVHNNDLSKAEEWLREQAQALGWAKATKLDGRQTTQGLIGVAVNEGDGVMVEVNCETDFVAKNAEFQNIVELATNSCLSFLETCKPRQEQLTKICLDTEQLKCLKAKDGKPLADHLALLIGSVGENASLKRATCLKVGDGMHLAGYAHPSGNITNNVHLGRLAGLVAVRSNNTELDVDDIAKKLCQHIVGMNPQKIGGPNDEPAKDADNESCLIHQEYLHDDSLKIKDVLEESNVEVIEFKRFECGESPVGFGDQPLEFVETCQ